MDAKTFVQRDLEARFEGCFVPDLVFDWIVIGGDPENTITFVEFIVKPSINSTTVLERITSEDGIDFLPSVNSCRVIKRTLGETYIGGETNVYALLVTYSDGGRRLIFKGNFPILKP